jgi:hypothetical protein
MTAVAEKQLLKSISQELSVFFTQVRYSALSYTAYSLHHFISNCFLCLLQYYMLSVYFNIFIAQQPSSMLSSKHQCSTILTILTDIYHHSRYNIHVQNIRGGEATDSHAATERGQLQHVLPKNRYARYTPHYRRLDYIVTCGRILLTY